MRKLAAALSLSVLVAGSVGAMMTAPIPLEDLYSCMEDPTVRPEGSGVCLEFNQIVADVYWAYLWGRPVVVTEEDPILETWALLSCFDDPEFTPPEFNDICVGNVLESLWRDLNP